jgi:hypothetical protein
VKSSEGLYLADDRKRRRGAISASPPPPRRFAQDQDISPFTRAGKHDGPCVKWIDQYIVDEAHNLAPSEARQKSQDEFVNQTNRPSLSTSDQIASLKSPNGKNMLIFCAMCDFFPQAQFSNFSE